MYKKKNIDGIKHMNGIECTQENEHQRRKVEINRRIGRERGERKGSRDGDDNKEGDKDNSDNNGGSRDREESDNNGRNDGNEGRIAVRNNKGCTLTHNPTENRKE